MASLTKPPGDCSTTEYHFEDEQADAIIQTTAYHRRDYCLSVIWFPPSQHDIIRSSIATPFQRPSTSTAGLGDLDCLPLELLCETLQHLDMRSLFKFRQVNSSSRQVVDSLPQYQRIVTYGLRLFCALLRTRTASEISLNAFHTALYTKTCKLCNDFAGFIFLPSWTRICPPCILCAGETRMRPLDTVNERLRLTSLKESRLKPFYALPGIYTMGQIPQETRRTLVLLCRVFPLCDSSRRRALHSAPSSGSGSTLRNGSYLERKCSYMASCALPYLDRQTGVVERGVLCAGCHVALEDKSLGARGVIQRIRARDMVYSREGFLKHFRVCGYAQRLWEASDEGARRPPGLPVFAQMGGEFRRRNDFV
ncbi:hypothetical protein BDW74DRAFT_29052 [Aspergillus multicolor]|uniref:F-box protein n=1 Tax=Aspergillus multicolor TaxID=41759 RepID=UPI003CCCCD13